MQIMIAPPLLKRFAVVVVVVIIALVVILNLFGGSHDGINQRRPDASLAFTRITIPSTNPN
jgi:hypothetical protein